MRAPNVYTIPAGVPFVDALAAGLVHLCGDDRQGLSGAWLLLPTRRACRALREAFLRLGDGRPMLLPRLTPLGDVDEDELALAGWTDSALGGGGFQAPPAVSALKRQLSLTRLILADASRHVTADQAAHLALELARLIDQVHTERVGFDGLAELVPEAFAGHWQKTIEFLKIVTEHWPRILADEGAVDPAERRNRLLEAQAETWRENPPADPVIAAGSTGSIPATADLLAVVSRLPRGAVVLPGLDANAGPEVWRALTPAHPQYGMGRLLRRLGVDPATVEEWPAHGLSGTSPKRAALIHSALRPSAARGLAPAPAAEDGLEGVSRIDCASPQEEAGVIALVLREALETPGRTAALVTPDRGLARRVAAELGRWGVEADDSAGTPLDQTPPGAFLRLTAGMAAEKLAPVPLLAALKHPLAAGARDPASFRRDVRRLEMAALRGPRPAEGLDGLRKALPRDETSLRDFVAALDRAIGPFLQALRRPTAPLRDLLKAHVAAAEALAASEGEDGPSRLWAGEDGEAAATFVSELGEAATALARIRPADYPALLEALMAGRVVRPSYGKHPRLYIWGLLEARLQHADVLVLGGLNEGTWPPEARPNPWMSRPMLHKFGLPPPERRIGLTAHDFCQAFSATRVVLTRATRVEGTPTVPSRWLLLLENQAKRLGKTFASDPRWLSWGQRLDAAEPVCPVRPPAPKPPVAVRPRRLSVTRVETWVRDPYAVYARLILNLRPLDPLDADPGAADRGSIVHEALERFVRAHPTDLPDDAVAKLLAIGRSVFAEALARPGVRAFWWPRFERIAEWFVALERERREAGVTALGTEVAGALELAGPAGPFTLTAKADRVDRTVRGDLAIIDYKTGQPPTWKQVKSGLAPQLTLEAAIAQEKGFDGIAAGPVSELSYVHLSGGRVPGTCKVFEEDVAGAAAQALAGLKRRIAAFDDADTPYLSRLRPAFESRPGDYDHLARVKEWPLEEEDTR